MKERGGDGFRVQFPGTGETRGKRKERIGANKPHYYSLPSPCSTVLSIPLSFPTGQYDFYLGKIISALK